MASDLAGAGVGFSTGAVARGDVDAGIVVSRSHGRAIVELSSLSESELPSVEAAAATLATDATFTRVSVHGPVKHRQLPEAELVDRLAALGHDVVMHPDVFVDVALWAALGDRLLIENNDARKALGRTPEDLDRFFDQLPDARFCLDVSHAVDAGGPQLARRLAARFADRTVQLHVGCACGHAAGVALDDELCSSVLDVCDTLGFVAPVILERSTPAVEAGALTAQLAAVAAATGRFAAP